MKISVASFVPFIGGRASGKATDATVMWAELEFPMQRHIHMYKKPTYSTYRMLQKWIIAHKTGVKSNADD